MKKIFIHNKMFATAAAVVIFVMLSLTGCNTVSLNLSPAELSSVAIVSITSNSAIPWFVPDNERMKEEDGAISNSGISRMLNKTLRGNNPELLTIETRIDNAAEILIQSFKDYGVDVLPVEKVYEAPILSQNSFNFLTDFNGSTPAQGYGIISSSSKVRNKEICETTGAKTTCYVDYEFRKYKKEISLTENHVYAHVVLKAYIADENGKKIMQKDFTALSDDYVDMDIVRGYSKDKLVLLFPSAVKNACNQMMIYLTGITPEMNTKNINESALEELSDEQLSQATEIKLPVKKVQEETPAAEDSAEETADNIEMDEPADEPEVEAAAE